MNKVALAFFVPTFISKGDHEKSCLWVDFIRETAKSFDAECYLFGAPPRVAKHAAQNGCELAYCLRDLPGSLVVVDSVGEDLSGFSHPDNVTYLLGPDDWSFDLKSCAGVIRIDTPADYPLWSAVAAGIVLSHRLEQNN